MTTDQINRVRDMLLGIEATGTFVGLEMRPANENDSIYNIAVNPDGADLYVASGVVDDYGEHLGIAVINPVGDVIINYEQH